MLPSIGDSSSAVISSTHLHKTLYDGTKSYWRTRETVDVRIIDHIDASVLEIVAFNVEQYDEADRLYMDAKQLYKKLENAELIEKVEEKRAEYGRMRKRVPVEEITRTMVSEAAVQFILTRLVTTQTRKLRPGDALSAKSGAIGVGDLPTVLDEENEDDDKTPPAVTRESSTTGTDSAINAETDAAATTITSDSTFSDETTIVNADGQTEIIKKKSPKEILLDIPRFAVDLAILTGDRTIGPKCKERLEYLLDHVPTGIEQITIIRARKKASKKEFHSAIRELRKENDKLNKASSDAQRKAGLAVSSVDGFKSFARKNKYDPDTMSLAQWRWIWACGRVVLQNYVAAVTKRIEYFEMKRNGILPDNHGHGYPGGNLTPELESEQGKGTKSRRLKQSTSAVTKLPSLASKSGRHSMGSLSTSRRLSRGSREPRELDEFSSAFSGAIKKNADLHLKGRVSFAKNDTSTTVNVNNAPDAALLSSASAQSL